MTKQEIYFSIGEQEIIEILREEYKITKIEACEYVIAQKRELAMMHSQTGEFDLAEQILREIYEWNDQMEALFIDMGRGATAKEVKIITEI